MKTIMKYFYLSAAAACAFTPAGCSDLLTTQSSTEVSDATVLESAANLNMVLTASYKKLYFFEGDRVYAGLPGLQVYTDASGADIICHENYGSTQVQCYDFDMQKTRYTDLADRIWRLMYGVINQSNIVIDHIDAATGESTYKQHIKGQAYAMRGLCYFHLLLNYQQTYAIAKDKPGVILRLSSTAPNNLPRSTVEACYRQIVADLTLAKQLLDGFKREGVWVIDGDVTAGILARVYQVMGDWENAMVEAQSVYDRYGQLMTRDQYRSGFDDVISNGYAEVLWAVKFTDTDNAGGATQYNFWFNQDSTYGEGMMDGPIYSFLSFFVSPEYVELFEETEDRYQFWKRTSNPSQEIYTKWAYDKWKHYGDANGAKQGNTRPEVPLMRSSEMLLIMAEASAHLHNGKALEYLNRLQTARGVRNLTSVAGGEELLEAIYVERRKELLGEGVVGMYDLTRLKRPLIRFGEWAGHEGGHYSHGLHNLNNYNPSDSQPYGRYESNDYRFFCQIPETEMVYNEALTEADQNPFSGQ
jgi:hypothetical protein